MIDDWSAKRKAVDLCPEWINEATAEGAFMTRLWMPVRRMKSPYPVLAPKRTGSQEVDEALWASTVWLHRG